MQKHIINAHVLDRFSCFNEEVKTKNVVWFDNCICQYTALEVCL